MKVKPLTATTYAIFPIVDEMIDIDINDLIGINKGTHRFNDDLTAIVPKTQSEIYEEELARIKQKNVDEKNKLRSRRTAECFSIVNRGQLWYDRLTEEQITELNVWYQSWLDVTDTMVVPDKPMWIK